MSFSPEDIANRVFTPSAEGYHQGEVRDFLQRVAREVRSLHAAYAAQSGDGPLVPLPGAEPASQSISAAKASGPTGDGGQELRLTAISDRLESLIERLEDAAPQTAPAPPVTSTPAAAAATPPPLPAATPAGTPATPPPLAARQDPTTSVGDPTFIERVPPRQAPAERVPVVVEEAPTHRPAAATVASPSLPRVPTDKLSTPFGSISPADPMFSENANDLLDGVLDDVMGALGDD